MPRATCGAARRRARGGHARSRRGGAAARRAAGAARRPRPARVPSWRTTRRSASYVASSTSAVKTSSGSPSAMMRRLTHTTHGRCAATELSSWVVSTMVTPCALRSASRWSTSSRVRMSTPLVGSSSSSSAGLADHRPGQEHPLLLAARQLPDLPVAQAADAQPLEHPVRLVAGPPRSSRGASGACAPAAHQHDLAHGRREVPVDRLELGHPADVRGSSGGDVAAADDHPAPEPWAPARPSPAAASSCPRRTGPRCPRTRRARCVRLTSSSTGRAAVAGADVLEPNERGVHAARRRTPMGGGHGCQVSVTG